MKLKILSALLATSAATFANTWTHDSLDYQFNINSPSETKSVSSLDGTWKITQLRKTGSRPDVGTAEKSGNWKPDIKTTDWKDIEVPHGSWHQFFPDTYPDPKKKYSSFHFDGHPTYVSGWFSNTFTVPSGLKGSQLYLNFGAISWEAHIWLNGRKAGTHKGSFTGFKLNITDMVRFDQLNTIRIWVYNDFGENPPRHTYGKMFFSASNPGGINGGVTLEALPPVNILRCLINPEPSNDSVGLDLTVDNTSNRTISGDLSVVLKGGIYPDFKVTKEFSLGTATLKKGGNKLSMKFNAGELKAWSPAEPYLYQIYIVVKDKKDGKVVCSYRDRFGYRDFRIRDKKFFLNGKRVRVYCGNIMTAGLWGRFDPGNKKIRDDMRRQKRQGANAIRYHMAGADSHRMLAMADEEGILVISEFPMFHRVFNDLAFRRESDRKEFMDNVLYEWEARLFRDYNYPSCVIWSLSNEVWTDSTVDELNDIYTAIKPLDKQDRPMSADSGIHSFGIPTIKVKTDFWDAHLYDLVSKIPYTFASVDFDRYFDDLKSIYGKLDRPSVAFECLHLGFGKPSKKIEFNHKLSVEEYLKLTEKNKSIDISFMGLRHFLDWKDDGMYILNSIAKNALEQFRQETRLQGFHPWWNKRNIIFEDYPLITSPVFVGAVQFPPNQFAGRRMEFDAVMIKDPLEKLDTNVTMRLASSSDNAITSTNSINISLPKNQDKTPFKAAVDIPASAETGRYKLQMVVTHNGTEISRNYYNVNILNPRDIPEIKSSDKKLAVFEPDSSLLKDILGSKVEYKLIDNPGNLNEYSRLVIHATTHSGWDKVVSNSGAIRQWVKKGGRLLIMEVPFSAPLEWIMQGYKIEKNDKEFDNVSLLMEPVLRDHPLFKGLSVDSFLTMNGAKGVVGDALISPLGRNVVATGFTCSRQHPAAGLVYEANIDKGGCMVSQVRALERFENDSSAVLYLNNLFNYFFGNQVYSEIQPLAVQEDSGLRKEIKSVIGTECRPIDLLASANRGLKDDKPNDGKGGWTDFGVNDFRHAPIEKQTFLNIPFKIINPDSNNDKAVIILKGMKCPDFPAEKTIAVNGKCRRLFFLHTTWYLNAGKKLMEYVVNYADDTKTVIPVEGGKDVGDWYAPSDQKNAVAVWSGNHPVVSAPFGFYLMPWKNPYPAKTVKSITVRSMGQSVPIVMAISRQDYVEYSESVLKMPWNFTSGKDIGKSFGLTGMVQNKNICRFRMSRPHAWLSPNSHDKVIDAAKWYQLSFSLKSSDALRIKIIYFAPGGDNGGCAWLTPTKSKNGWNYYNIDLKNISWNQGTSPEAKQWGGREHQVSWFAIDLYSTRAGTTVEIGSIRLFKD